MLAALYRILFKINLEIQTQLLPFLLDQMVMLIMFFRLVIQVNRL